MSGINIKEIRDAIAGAYDSATNSLRTSGGGGGSSTISTNTSIDYGNGAVTNKTQRVAIASDNTPTVLLGAGSNAIGSISNTSFASTQSGTWTVGLSAAQTLATVTNLAQLGGQAIAMGTGVRTAGTQRVTIATDDTLTLSAETGFLSYRNTALLATPQSVKASAGSVQGLNLINQNTVPVYLKFYNLAVGSVTVGTSTPLFVMMIPASDGVNHGLVYVEPQLIPLEVFSTAISIACVTGIADNSTAAPSTGLYCGIRYK